jgi:Protein of unknown function (DUF3046)
VRLTEFWERMATQFGPAYSRSVAADYRVPTLGTTVDEAIAAGIDTKAIWLAVCDAFELPASVR